MFVLGLLLAGCGGTVTPAPLVEVPPIEPAPRTGLVWIRDADGHDRTLWVDTQGEPMVSAPIEGPLWADGHALWQLVREEVAVPLYGEDPGDGPLPEPTGEGRVQRLVLRELVADALVELSPAPAVGAVGAVEHAVDVEGSVGPFLFVVEQLYVEAWGAHGAEDHRQKVWDLRTAAYVDLPTEREQTAWDARGVELRDDAEQPPEGELSLVAVHPHWDLDAGLQVELHFAGTDCYACGDGQWSDYTRSIRGPLERTPERLDGDLPAWAAAAARRAGGTLMGFTVVSEPEPTAILDALSR